MTYSKAGSFEAVSVKVSNGVFGICINKWNGRWSVENGKVKRLFFYQRSECWVGQGRASKDKNHAPRNVSFSRFLSLRRFSFFFCLLRLHHRAHTSIAMKERRGGENEPRMSYRENKSVCCSLGTCCSDVHRIQQNQNHSTVRGIVRVLFSANATDAYQDLHIDDSAQSSKKAL